MSLKLFSHALTGKAAIAQITDKEVLTTQVFDRSNFGRWTHLVKIETDLFEPFEKDETLFLYNQYKRDGAIGKLKKTGFVAEQTFDPGSFGVWSHIAAVGSLLFFYNQTTEEGAVAATDPQQFKFEEVKIKGAVNPDFPTIKPSLSKPGLGIPGQKPVHSSTNQHFVTVSTYASGSLGKWTHLAASGSYLFFYNAHNRSGRISKLVNEPLTAVKDLAVGAKVSLTPLHDLNKGAVGSWTHIVGAAPYLLFYDERSGSRQVARVSDAGLTVISKLADSHFGRWTHLITGVNLIKTTQKESIVPANGLFELPGVTEVSPDGASVLFYDALSGAGVLGQLRDDSFKTVKTYGANDFGRWTNISATAVSADPLAQYTLSRSPSSLKLMDYQGGSTELVLPTDKLTPEQQEDILNKTTEKLLDFLADHRDEAKDGKLSAADIGGVIYGAAGALIADVFVPGLGGTIFGEILKKGSEQAGRYYGAAVDTLIDTLNRLDDVQIADIVGTLATVHIIALYFPWMPVTGTDGWSFTVEVGKKLGKTTVDAINTIGGIVEDVTGAAIKLAEDAANVVKGVWDSIF